MKKLLFLFCFTLSLYSHADMDKICLVTVGPGAVNPQIENQIKDCQTNNILHLFFIPSYLEIHSLYAAKDTAILTQSKFCRFDRNVSFDGQRFTCVLYDNKPREFN